MRSRTVLLATLAIAAMSVILLAAPGCGDDQATTAASPSPSAPDEMTLQNTAVGEKVMEMAADAAGRLAGEYADLHPVIVAAGDRDLPEHDRLHKRLAALRDELGATYVYTLIKVSDDMTNLIVDAAVGDDADEFGTEYEMEPQMAAAFDGQPAYAQHTWVDESYGVQKSAFAPLFDSQGEIVAILGIDFPAPELEKYPELVVD